MHIPYTNYWSLEFSPSRCIDTDHHRRQVHHNHPPKKNSFGGSASISARSCHFETTSTSWLQEDATSSQAPNAWGTRFAASTTTTCASYSKRASSWSSRTAASYDTDQTAPRRDSWKNSSRSKTGASATLRVLYAPPRPKCFTFSLPSRHSTL